MSEPGHAHGGAVLTVQRPVAATTPKGRLDVAVSGVKYLTMSWSPGPTLHRADYLFERGVWRATCRECGWQTADAARRQAALLFRAHIRQTTEVARQAHADQMVADAETGGEVEP